jgi:hypothetical protein
MKEVQNLLDQQRSHIANAEGHESAIAEARKKLAVVQARRNERAHLEKVLAQDTGAIRSDEKLSQEESILAREVASRTGLAADSRRLADSLTPQIESARFVAATEVVQAQSSNVARFTEQARPQLDSFAALVERLQSDALGLIADLKALPDPAPRQLRTIVERLQGLFSQSFLAELSKVFKAANIGFPIAAGDFDQMTGSFFSSLQKALATLSATRAGGGPGRRLCRCVGGISGLSGGLQATNGEIFALLMDDPETQKFVASGALVVEISEGSKKGVAA